MEAATAGTVAVRAGRAAPRDDTAPARLGGMALLGLRVAAALARPPFAWRRELAIFSASALRRALPAIVVSIAAWGFAGPGLQAGNFMVLFGAPDRLGGC